MFHKLLVSDTVPCNLLGRDLLSYLQACVQYTPNGVEVHVGELDEEIICGLIATELEQEIEGNIPPEIFAQIPDILWAKGKYDLGLLQVPPVKVKIKAGAQI